MKRKLVSGLLLAGMAVFGAQAEGFTGSLYIEDATISPGGTATLSVQLTNDIPISGFQFKMTLPEGISYNSWDISEERLPSTVSLDNCIKTQTYTNHVFSCAASLPAITIEGAESFMGTSGEIATITITADESLAEGSYTITVTEIDVNDSKGRDYDYEDGIEDTSFTLTVAAISYDEGYAVEALPFAFVEDVEIPLVMDNLTAITNLSLDVVFPSILVDNELYYIDNPLGKTKFAVSDELQSEGSVHVTVDRRSTNEVSAGKGNKVITLGLIYDESAVPKGIYPITIKNIVLTDGNGNTYLAAPYTTEIFVGDSPKATATNGVIAFHGNYGGADEFALLKASLSEGMTVDLTETSALAEDVTTLMTDNVFVTVDAVSYGRSMTNEWGTLCLPFAFESTEGFQIYKLTGVSETAISFDKVDVAEANTPLLFKTTNGGFVASTVNDGSFDVGYAAGNPSVSVSATDNWVWNGTYIAETADVSTIQAYALMNNEFHHIKKTLEVNAFRAWLQNNGAPMNAAIRISEGTDGIEFVELKEDSVNLIFDLQGRLQKEPPFGQIVVEHGQKRVSVNK